MHKWKPKIGIEFPAARRLLTRLDQDFNQQIGHHRSGNEIEHDRGDNDVATALGLQVSRDRRPSGAKQGRQGDAKQNDDWGGPSPEGKRGQADTQATEIGLPLTANVEKGAMECNGNGKSGENEVGREIERETEEFEIAERT